MIFIISFLLLILTLVHSCFCSSLGKYTHSMPTDTHALTPTPHTYRSWFSVSTGISCGLFSVHCLMNQIFCNHLLYRMRIAMLDTYPCWVQLQRTNHARYLLQNWTFSLITLESNIERKRKVNYYRMHGTSVSYFAFYVLQCPWGLSLHHPFLMVSTMVSCYSFDH
jgi:hypothetical protein